MEFWPPVSVRSHAKPKSITSIISGFIMVLALSACGMDGPAHKSPAPGAKSVIDIGFMSYSPAHVTIRSGDTVEWRNKSIITHTVTADPRHAKKPGSASVPAGAQPFDSGDIAGGQVYLHTFTTPGTYRYFCMHHDGMAGTVVVEPAS